MVIVDISYSRCYYQFNSRGISHDMKTYLIKLIGYKSNLRVVVGGRIIILTLVYNS